MKTLVIGLDSATPELLFEDERLVNFRRLMEFGCYGRLESIIPPITIPAWMCMATGQDPGSLGVYGFRNRADYSYDGLGIANSKSIQEITIWDQIAREGKRSIIIGVPPSYPPRKMNGICVGCMMTPDTTKDKYTFPADIKDEISKLVGEYPVDVKNFRTDKKDWLIEEIYNMSRKQFKVMRHLMQNYDWDYFQFVEIGLDRIHHGFWQYHDPRHNQYELGNPYRDVIRNYYIHLDNELEKILELLADDTAILVVSDHGVQRLDGGFCVNEWLIKEGLLVLNEYPKEFTPFSELDVNWEKTKVWSEGGYYARVFFNVKGREPHGVIADSDYEEFRNEIKGKFEATVDYEGNALGTLVFKPDQIYKTVYNVAPDLIVHFGNLYWRSIGSVGHQSIHLQENDTGPDACNHAQFGSFILAASNNPVQGEVGGIHLLDIAPTLLDLGGYDIPRSMQGKSLVAGKTLDADFSNGSKNGEEILRERLKGLGYIS
jgi:predicted AlkP superfamily phosphohydrolase/phosphomutase